MGKEVYQDPAAEQEAAGVGKKFMNSTDVVGDMSRTYGTDLRSVRIHTDDSAARQAADRGVDAFSTGRDVFFGRDAFHPEDPASRGLLAHELTHSLQQGVGGDMGGMEHSAPMGAEQGGFLDTMRRWFGRQQEEVEEEPAEVHPHGAAPAQWAGDEEAYGEIGPEKISDNPTPESPVWDMMHDSDLDGPGQSAVFETHAVTPRESDDGIGALYLHSFAGLRFTHRDPWGRGIRRRHIKVGFGGDGLRDDWYNRADVSTETPITMNQLDQLFREIPRLGSRPYDLLHYNCADFVAELSRIAGASLPAEYHSSLLGPAGAYKKAAAAATQGEQDRTRFFQGGTLHTGEGQLSPARRNELLSGFFQTAKVAARRDLTPFLLYARLRENASRMQNAAERLEPFTNFDFGGNPLIKTSADRHNLEMILVDVDQRGRELIQTETRVSHPRVNMVAMKTMALANEVSRVYFPKRHLINNEENRAAMLKSLDFRNGAEVESQREHMKLQREARAAGMDPNAVEAPEVDNTGYFMRQEEATAGFRTSQPSARNDLETTGELFIEAAGLTPEQLLRASLERGNPQEQVLDMLNRLRNGLQADPQRYVGAYAERFVSKHPFLNPSQMAASLAHAMVQQLYNVAESTQNAVCVELNAFRFMAASTAMYRGNKSLDNTQGKVGQYLEQEGRKIVPDVDMATRMEALQVHNRIEHDLRAVLENAVAQQAARRREEQA